jgi:hypothetical protein
MRPLRFVALAALLASPVVASLPATALAGAVGTTMLVDAPIGGAVGLDGAGTSQASGTQAMSADGNLVAFTSQAAGLIPNGDHSGVTYAFVRNRAAKTTTNVCRASGANGAVADSDCAQVAISPNGRWVVFASSATNLTPDDTSAQTSIFARDLASQTTTLVSRATGAAGASAAGDAVAPSVADNGNVAFETAAPLGGSSDLNSDSDVYVRSLTADTTTLVSRSPVTGKAGDATSSAPAISGNGTTVAFQSLSVDLDAADPSNGSDIYTAPAAGGTPVLQSRAGAAGAVGDDGSQSASIDYAGDRIAFSTDASNLLAGDAPGARDIVLRTIASGTNTAISVRNGTDTNLLGIDTDDPVISGDGNRVAFSTGNAGDLNRVSYLRTPSTHTTIDLAQPVGGLGTATYTDPAGLNTDGSLVALESLFVPLFHTPQVAVRNVASGDLALTSVATGADTIREDDSTTFAPSGQPISTEGRYVVMLSDSPSLVAGVSGVHLFRKDLATGEVVRVDQGVTLSDQSTYGYNVAMDASGNRVVFIGSKTGSSAEQVTIRDISSGTTTFMPAKSGGLIDNPDVDGMALSADGRVLALNTSNSLVKEDGNPFYDVYALDLTSATVSLVSRVDGESGGATGASTADDPQISRDGKVVAFETATKGVTSGAETGTTQVFVRHLDTGITELGSRANLSTGGVANASAHLADLSDDGLRVSFTTRATNLEDGDDSSFTDVHVRDLSSNRTMWASRTSTDATPDGEASGGGLSADGRQVQFDSGATNIVGGDTNGAIDGFVRELGSGAVVRATVASDGSQLEQGGGTSALSGNGKCLLFTSWGRGVVPAGYADASNSHLYLRAVGGECPTPPVVAPPVPGNPGAPGGPGQNGGKVLDKIAPVFSKLSLTAPKFRTKGKKAGTVLVYSLSEASTVKIGVVKTVRGALKGKTCVAPAKAPKRAKACVRISGQTVVAFQRGVVGKNKFKFAGKIKKKVLKRGTYRFVITATDAVGNSSTTGIKFTIL